MVLDYFYPYSAGGCGGRCFQGIYLKTSKIGIKKINFPKHTDPVTIQSIPQYVGAWATKCPRKSEGHFQDINVFILKMRKLRYSRWGFARSQR